MTIGLAIVGILIPMILEWQRKRSFTKELSMHLSQSEDALKKYTEEQTRELKAELTKQISSPLSIAFFGLSQSLYSEEMSPAEYGIRLQLDVLAMKFDVISQCSGGSLDASVIIRTYRDTGSQITLETLKAVDESLEDMKEDVDNINDDQKRSDMKSQVQELQIFVHGLIVQKQRTT